MGRTYKQLPPPPPRQTLRPRQPGLQRQKAVAEARARRVNRRFPTPEITRLECGSGEFFSLNITWRNESKSDPSFWIVEIKQPGGPAYYTTPTGNLRTVGVYYTIFSGEPVRVRIWPGKVDTGHPDYDTVFQGQGPITQFGPVYDAAEGFYRESYLLDLTTMPVTEEN